MSTPTPPTTSSTPPAPSALQAKARAKAEYWFVEDVAPGHKIQTILNKTIVSTVSQYQSIEIVDTYFGKTLITDGKSQSSQFDEFAYHESLVHPCMVLSKLVAGAEGGPKAVLIGGGGELATAREVLRWKSIQRVVMVDLDGELVDLCKQHLPEWGGEQVLNDPRFELVVGDAYKYIMETKEMFDVMIMDISDPIEAGPGIALYVQEFYQHAVTRLNQPHGAFVTQAGVADAIPPKHSTVGEKDTACFGPIRNTLDSVFKTVVPYSTNIPSFGGDWGFICAFQGDPTANEVDKIKASVELSCDDIDQLLEDCVEGPMKFYDGTTHCRMFHLPKPLRESLNADDRIMTRENPIFMY